MASNGETGALLLAASACVRVDVYVCVLEGQAAWQQGERRRQTREEERSTAGENKCGCPNTTV